MVGIIIKLRPSGWDYYLAQANGWDYYLAQANGWDYYSIKSSTIVNLPY